MRIVTGILTAGLVAGLSTAALADGWYVGAETGLNIAPTEKYKTSQGKEKIETDPGFGLIGEGGYAFGPVRVEGELGWRSNGISKVNGTDGKGGIDAYSLMVNGLYDVRTGTAWTPYFGAGIGGVDLSAHKIRNNTGTLTKDDDIVFGYQGIAGLSYALNDNLSLNADYRYLRTTEASLKSDNSNLTGKVKGPYEAHNVFVGFTYRFGGPEKVAQATSVAAPAPIPAPAPKAATQAVIAKSYLVFFDFDKSDITPEAQKIISQAATNAKASNATSIQLTGHTDAAGSEKYNMALSLRRANAVKAALTKLGIPDSEISVIGKGKSDPLVPTKDGVREPQNRRVQILLP